MKTSLIGRRSSKAVYGVILITAALIGFQLHVTDPLDVALKVFLAGLVIVVAEIYSEFLGEKIKTKRSLTRQERREIVYDATGVSAVAFYPVLLFLIASTGLYSVEWAFKLSYALSLVALGVFGYVASQYAGDTKVASYTKAITATAIGLLVILVKYYFSH